MFGRIMTIAMATVALAASGASAINYTWYGTTSDQWNDVANWDNGIPTTTGDGYTYINAVTSPAKEPNIPVGQTGRVAGLTVGNGGRLYINGTLTTGSTNTVYANVNSGAIVELTGTLDVTKNLYVGTNAAGTAIINVRPGGAIVPHGGTTLTLGQTNAANIGQLNIWGTVTMSALRWGYQGGTGRVTLYDNGRFILNFTSASEMQALIDSGAIKSGTAAYIPAVFSTLDPNTTTVRLVKAPYATGPAYTPALIGSSAQLNAASGSITLSWDGPLPSDPTKPVTNGVYFGLDNGGTLPLVGSTGNSSMSVSINKLNQYAWRVDTYDPNTGVTTPSAVWKFNTNNVAPTVSAEAGPIWTWMTAPAITLHASAVDDGYPLPSNLTYTWSQVGGTDVPGLPATGPNVTLSSFPYAMPFNFQVIASDGTLASAPYAVQVRVFTTPCAAAKDKSPSATMAGDFNKDCTVNFIDVGTLAGSWLACNSADLICP